MSSSTLVSLVSLTRRIGSALLALTAALAIAGVGCQQGQEGDRCNPLLSHDECGSGFSCQQPASCPENYCCPVSGNSQNPYCQAGCAGGIDAICAASPSSAACQDAGSDTGGGHDAAPPSPDAAAGDSSATD